jgi:hypothetical protein
MANLLLAPIYSNGTPIAAGSWLKIASRAERRREELPIAGDDFAVLDPQVGNLYRQLQLIAILR